MDRSRRMPQRRRPLGASASPTSTSEASFDFNPITSPVVAQTNTTPGGRRSTKPLQHAFTFSPPSSSRNSNPKRRSTTMDNFPMQDEGEHGPKKGGHSLRKRARVDYTFEHIDDDVVVPNSTSSARGKKRRSEINFDTDDFYNNDSKRRGASMGADTPSSRRRNPTRKSSDLKAFHQAALQDDDNEVQDTIEVGAYYSDVDDSELRDGADSNNSSPQSKMSPKTSPQKSPQNESTKNELPAPQFHNGFQIGPSTENAASSSEVNQVISEKPYLAVEHISNSIEELVSQPAEPQAENFPNAEPEPATYNYQQPSTTLEADYPLTPLETAVPSTKPQPAASATALTVPDISIKAEEAEPAAVSVSAPELAPTIAQLPITADENNQSEPIHSAIVPASQPEPANIVSELPPAEPTSQLNPEPESLTSSTTTIIEEKEAPQQPIVEQVEQEQIPEPPTQLPDQHQEEKMDEMDIDPLLEENVPQDIEMTDAAAIDTPAAQDKVSTPSPEPTSTSALGPADLPSPLPSNTIPSSPPKSPAKLRSPSPAQEDEQPPQETIIPSPNADTDEIRMSVELSNDHQTETENVNKEVVEENNEDKEPEPVEMPVTADEPQVPDSPQNHITQEEPAIVSSPLEPKAPTPPPAETIETPASSAPSETKPSPQKPVAPRVPLEFMPQPTPVGRWSNLKPYVEGEFTMYPEKKGNEDGNDDVTPEGKDADRDADMEPMVDDQDDAGLEAPTPALNTPTRGSPVPDSADPTALNSPAPAGEDGDEADESQELSERTRYYKYRKLRDPEEYVSVLENYEDMSTEELYELLEAVNVSMVQWQDEWTEQGAIVDDYENSLRRRAADSKYEARTRNLHQHGINYEEPEFAVKGYKSREKEGLTETRYLQGQDRIMAATYGFEYDPHPSKIGKQNPGTQQVGVMTRGRSLRNQPRQTAKATEGEEVVGKRQRKPVQLFDPTTQDVSRSSTPVPATRATGRRRKNANAEDEPQTNLAVSFTSEVVSDGEGPKTRRKRGTRSKNVIQEEEAVPTPDAEEAIQESPQKPTRRGRARPAVKYEEADPNEFVDEEPQEEEEEAMEEPEENEKVKEEKPTVRRHLVTLKLPSGYFEATPEMEIVDNGDSRPTTACSEESSQTVESSYSFRPKRQKRFRDDPDETEESGQAPPKKRGKRTSGGTTVAEIPSTASTPAPSTELAQPMNSRKIQKIKVVRSGQDTKNGGTPQATPAPPPPPPPPAPATPTPTPGPVDDNDDTPKDYKSMTKSEKMSASMKNRWANGNMAGAVEKRKATLAAKKAAQAAAEQRTGVVAPKPKGKTPMKRDSTLKMQMAPEQPQMPLQQQPPPPPHMMHQQPPPMHPHQHQHHPHQYPVHHQHPQHHHQHPPPPPPHPAHMQQMHHPQHMPPHPPPPPPHQPGNPPPPFMHGHGQHPNHGHGHGMPGMGYHY